jgi:hypothetical protein
VGQASLISGQPAPKYWSHTLAAAAVTAEVLAMPTSCPQAAKQFNDCRCKREQSESTWQAIDDVLSKYD